MLDICFVKEMNRCSMSRIFNRVVCFLLLGSVLLGCRGDNRLTIFEMVFPNITFDLPAGLTGSLPRVFAIDDLRTNYQRYLRDNNTDTALIQGIEPVLHIFVLGRVSEVREGRDRPHA